MSQWDSFLDDNGGDKTEHLIEGTYVVTIDKIKHRISQNPKTKGQGLVIIEMTVDQALAPLVSGAQMSMAGAAGARTYTVFGNSDAVKRSSGDMLKFISAVTGMGVAELKAHLAEQGDDDNILVSIMGLKPVTSRAGDAEFDFVQNHLDSFVSGVKVNLRRTDSSKAGSQFTYQRYSWSAYDGEGGYKDLEKIMSRGA